MATQRQVTVERIGPGRFAAVNQRGGTVSFGTGEDADFTPTELLLAAIGGCTAIDVDILTSRRAQPTSFQVDVGADKVRDDDGNRLTDIAVTFHVTFPAGAGRRRSPRGAASGRAAVARPAVHRRSHRRAGNADHPVRSSSAQLRRQPPRPPRRVEELVEVVVDVLEEQTPAAPLGDRGAATAGDRRGRDRTARRGRRRRRTDASTAGDEHDTARGRSTLALITLQTHRRAGSERSAR